MSYKHYNNGELIAAIKACSKELESRTINSENPKKEDVQYILTTLMEKMDIVKTMVDLDKVK